MRPHRVSLFALASVSLALADGCASPPHGGGPFPAFAALDANQDDAIDAEEFRKLSDAMFERLDADRDRRISEAEYKKLAEPRPPRRRPQGPGSGGSDGGWPGGGGGGPY